jgi:hypothetical protein
MFTCCLHHNETEKTQGVLWKNGVGRKKIPFEDLSIFILGRKKVKFCSKNKHWFQLVCRNSWEISRSRSEPSSSCTLIKLLVQGLDSNPRTIPSLFTQPRNKHYKVVQCKGEWTFLRLLLDLKVRSRACPKI